jgi:cytochrome c
MTRIKFPAAAPLLTVVAVLAGCSKSSQSSQAPAPAPAQSATSTSTASGAAPTDYGTSTSPGPGKIALNISVDGGEAVYGDPVAGKQVFNQCVSCHAVEAGQNKVGPTLHGVIGRPAGTIPGFRYSDSNKKSGKVWTEQELYTYLANPQKELPGTYMTYIGVSDPQKRADVIAYLQENTK